MKCHVFFFIEKNNWGPNLALLGSCSFLGFFLQFMLESFLGVLIAAISISSLILSIQSMENSYRNAGKQSLTQQEIGILTSAGLNSESNLNLLNGDIDNLPQSY